jgi:predicted TIM-barrel fold metal-dependent hydrolase
MSFDENYHHRNLPPVRQEWLSLHQEEVFEPGWDVVDTHHHLWEIEGSHYLADDLVADLKQGHNVKASVFVECKARYWTHTPTAMQPVGETVFAVQEAQRAERLTEGRVLACAGIVGYADLSIGSSIQAVLEAHVSNGQGRFRGIRSRAAWHAHPDLAGPVDGPPDNLLLDPTFQDGFARLKPLNLACDVWVYHTQLLDVCALADRFPETSIILDHMGGPLGIGPFKGKQSEVFDAWRKSLRVVAQRPNVTIKLGGLGMPRIGFGFETLSKPASSDELAAAWQPYFDACLEIFGASRCMFESNFPVDKGMSSYLVLLNAYKKMARRLTVDERQNILHHVGARIYNLNV